jgi:hypothetical protein
MDAPDLSWPVLMVVAIANLALSIWLLPKLWRLIEDVFWGRRSN